MTARREPLVSVIVPAFNAGRTLAATLDSVLAQTFADFECWIVNDGSTDESAQIAAQYCADDRRFTLINRDNQGVASARNAGLERARGQFIAALDADDLWHPDFLRSHVNVLTSSPEPLGFTYCHARIIDTDDKVTGTVLPYVLEGQIVQSLRYHNAIGNPSMAVFRREAVAAVGGYDSRLRELGCQGSEDWLLLKKVANTWPVRAIPSYLTGYRKANGSMSSDLPAMAYSAQMAAQFFAAECPSPLPAKVVRWQDAASAFQFARHGFASGRKVSSLSNLAAAFRLDPKRSLAWAADWFVNAVSRAAVRADRRFVDLHPTDEFLSYRFQRPFCHKLTERRLHRLQNLKDN